MTAETMYLTGLVVMAGFGLGHFGGFVQATRAARRDPDMADLTRDMRAKTTRVMGFEASILDFREYFSWAATRHAADAASVVHGLTGIYAIGMLFLLATSIRFRVAQGVVTCSLLVLLFGSAWGMG